MSENAVKLIREIEPRQITFWKYLNERINEVLDTVLGNYKWFRRLRGGRWYLVRTELLYDLYAWFPLKAFQTEEAFKRIDAEVIAREYYFRNNVK